MIIDQAETLRRRIRSESQERKAKTLAVISGKGGVGKSNFSLNFSLALQKLGEKVLLIDLDIGMGNIEILMGETSKQTIVNYFDTDNSLQEVINSSPLGLDYISGGTGLSNLFTLDKSDFERFSTEFNVLLNMYDYIIFDMGAGISSDSLKFILSTEEIILLTTPEPTALTDAYASIKYIMLHSNRAKLSVLVNRCENEKIAFSTYERLSKTVEKFLEKQLTYIGYLPEDAHVMKAVLKQVPILIEYKYSPFSHKIQKIAASINQYARNDVHLHTISFVEKLRGFFKWG